MEPDLGTLVKRERARDARTQPPADEADPMGLTDEDFASMTTALGISEARLSELLEVDRP